MCFSATASFVTAGIAGTFGALSLSRTREPREWPLAATPLLFGLQQAVEGTLWLTLPVAPDAPATIGLVLLFLLAAEVLWPVYVPLTVVLIEPNHRRRRWMVGCLAGGVGVGAYLLWSIVVRPFGAVIVDGHIVYSTQYWHPGIVSLCYMAATTLAPVLSSYRTVAVLGLVIFAGSAVSWVFYWEAFVSVWCFFAAAASVVILGHFEHVRRAQPVGVNA